MKRLPHILLTTLTSISLLLSAATAILWLRSVPGRDALTYITPSGDAYLIATVPHGLTIGFHQVYQDLIAHYDPQKPGWSRSHHAWGSNKTFDVVPIVPGVHEAYFSVTYAPPQLKHQLLGFAWERSTIPKPIPFPQRIAGYLNYTPPTTQSTLQTATLVLPAWFLLTTFAALPAVRSISFVRRHARPKGPHLCPTCNYDLRATPDRCPECGNPSSR